MSNTIGLGEYTDNDLIEELNNRNNKYGNEFMTRSNGDRMITRESFITIMDAIRTQRELDDNNGKLLTTFADPNSEFRDVVFTTPMVYTMMKMLASEMKCKQCPIIGNDIEWWIYESEHGDKFDTVTQDGKTMSVRTAGDFYDFLIGEPNYNV